MKPDTYQDLEVWKQSKDLVSFVYSITKSFPRDEQFGLTNQLRRAAVSIPSNIAEGCGRNHFKDSIQFLFIARGSLYELETQMIITYDLQYISQENLAKAQTKIKSCKRLLNGFINYFQSLRNDQSNVNEPLEEYLDRNVNS
jgi:four helix bundle protein